MAPDRLYFVVRADLSEGRRAAQLIHAMDEWAALHGPQRGTVVVYGVPSEQALLETWRQTVDAQANGVVFREPDLKGQATAFATDHGPLELPLLGSPLCKSKAAWRTQAAKRAEAMRRVMRPTTDRPCLPTPPTSYDQEASP